MCGILGVISKSSQAEYLVKQSMPLLHHRGPDDQGICSFVAGQNFVTMGHLRLSIIDLSIDGRQPMFYDHRNYVIIFNGEIYNYKELKKDLQQIGKVFVSRSDTEVLIAAWSAWGIDCLPKLKGMFAFAIYEKQRKHLYLVRDAFGIKPLYYFIDPNQIAFCSETTALLKILESKPEMNMQKVYDYLVHGDVFSNDTTFFNKIQRVAPGTFIKIDTETRKIVSKQKWWLPTCNENTNISFGDATDEIRNKILASVNLHLRSDVPLGVALSGGIDSSTIACAMRTLQPNKEIHTFSFIANEKKINEEKWIDEVNNFIGAKSHKIKIKPEEFSQDLEDLIYCHGEPFGSTSIYAQYRVFKKSQEQGIKVILDGQGADELFAGYKGFPGHRLRSLLEKGKISEAWKFVEAWSQWPGRTRVLALKYFVSEITTGKLYKILRSYDGRLTASNNLKDKFFLEQNVNMEKPRIQASTKSKGRRVVEELHNLLTRRGLSSLLRVEDRNSMRFSIECRVPFLITDIAEFCLQLPEEFLISNEGKTKNILRAALRGIVPPSIIERKDKIGFETSEAELIKNSKNLIFKILKSSHNINFLNTKHICHEFDLIQNGSKPYQSHVWRFINFIKWHEKFIQ